LAAAIGARRWLMEFGSLDVFALGLIEVVDDWRRVFLLMELELLRCVSRLWPCASSRPFWDFLALPIYCGEWY
jgi:hypothetical protein